LKQNVQLDFKKKPSSICLVNWRPSKECRL